VFVFILALISLVILTIGFIYDFMSSLRAVELEIKHGLENNSSLGQQLSYVSSNRKYSNQKTASFQNLVKPFWIL
jgi:hypothetical protein